MILVDVLVWIGTLTFAATGAIVAVRKGFDLVGVLVLGAVTAIGGGSIRDVIVGVLPPTNFTDETLLWIVGFTCILVFLLPHRVREESRVLYVLDTLGLYAKDGRVDPRRVLILRTASNYSRPAAGRQD